MDQVVIEELRGAYRGRRVLVVGDTGFKGSWLSECLLWLGARVAGYALPAPREQDHFALLSLASRIQHHDGDVRDLALLWSIFQKHEPEVVIHLAAQPLVRASYEDPKTTFDTNIGGGVNVLECVRRSPFVRSLVFITSDKCYKNKEWVWGYRENDELGGDDPYSASKAAMELVFNAYGKSFLNTRSDLGVATTRAGNVIGGGDWSLHRLVPDCIRALQKGDPIVVRNPGSTRPWQHVLEPVFGYLLLGARLLARPEGYRGSWNFGPRGEDARPVADLARRAISAWGEGRLEITPEQGAPSEAGLLQLDCERARQKLGWKPSWRFDEAVDNAVSWYRRVWNGEAAVNVTQEQIHSYVEVVR